METGTQGGAGQQPPNPPAAAETKPPAATNAQAPADQPQVKTAPAIPAGMKRIRLTRSIVLGGEHAEEGSVFDVAQALAHRLVGEGSAAHHVPEQAPTSVNRIVTPTNADPKPRQVAPAPPKVKKAK